MLAHAIDNPPPPPSPADRWPDKDGNPAYEPLVPAGETVNEGGLYDPSLAYTPDGKTGWLAYSAVLRRGTKYVKQFPIGPYCETHLAKTADGGNRLASLPNFDCAIALSLLNSVEVCA